jgi:hypothetical protein
VQKAKRKNCFGFGRVGGMKKSTFTLSPTREKQNKQQKDRVVHKRLL